MKYHGKFEAPRKGRRLSSVAALALALVLLVSAGGTLAYLFTSTDPVENTFSPAEMGIVIHENNDKPFDGKKKTNVYVENTSQADVYIRVALVPTWEDGAGNAVAIPASLNDLEIDWGSNWSLQSDGYYYYTKVVAAGDTTEPLIDTATVKIENGYHMNLQILAQAIQADGVDSDTKEIPVYQAWKVNPTELTPNLTN